MVQGHQSQMHSQKLHPFFSRDPATATSTPAPTTSSSDEQQPHSTTHEPTEDERRKRRKLLEPATSQDVDSGSGTAPFPPQMLQKDEMIATYPSHSMQEHKSPISTVMFGNDGVLQRPSDASKPAVKVGELPSTPQADAPSIDEAIDTSAGQATGRPRRQRKVLTFNMSTGTLGSPPKPKQAPKASRIVSMKYGNKGDEVKQRIGNAITQILDGTLQLPVTPTKKRVRKPRAKKVDQNEGQNTAIQAPHPFFGGKPKAQGAMAKPQEATRAPSKPRNTVFMTTPVSPRKARMPFDASKVAHFGSQKAGITKVPGAMHPMWPAQGMSQVLGNGDQGTRASSSSTTEPPRKSKGQVVTIPPSESVLNSVVRNLGLQQLRSEPHRSDTHISPPPEGLRLPTRHFESGRKLRTRIESQLRSNRGMLSDKSGEQVEFANTSSHAAIASLYQSLETQLSAYDRSTCENLAWAQKYAPKRAAEILQSAREGPLLKEWLEALRVQSVDTGSQTADGKTSAKQEKPPKRRKKNQLEGFIVDSDDEIDELNAVSYEDEEEEDSSCEDAPSMRTVVRNGPRDPKDSRRLKNAVLISGPPGCGKTAAVYAVAKELEYEIFEINPCSRRSGKDMMEKVGDMTRNHLVQQHRAEKAASDKSDDGDATLDDVKSGKQGTMTSFFKPKAGVSDKAKKVKNVEKSEDTAKNSAPKAQKQSLILVEEVDVLFKEDTQFWATLMTMISQSKRPFILTCNDESLVPIHSLALHGIFRFTPPPANLAVDVCLLIAANEGHALRRNAVEAAYRSRGEDLRATLMDLNYWCQLGVGDRRGGFDWFLLRWPRGCDLDEHGDTLRVVSEDTYSRGMGWVGRDAITSQKVALETDEEIMHQLWNLWETPVGHWQQTLDLRPLVQDLSASSPDAHTRVASLAAYDDFCEMMSVSDLCADGTFGSSLQQEIDATLPDLPAKARDDYIVGRQLLEAEPVMHQSCPSASIAHCLASLARTHLLEATEPICGPVRAAILKPLDESSAISALDASFDEVPRPLVRYDFSLAFDPLAISDRALVNSLDPSVFDRTLRLIVLDVAPWVRGIVAYDSRLAQERTKLSSLLSEGGNGKGRKRMRTTRSALSALEGGERRSTRGEKWFKGVGTGLVLRTGADGWAEAARVVFEAQQQAHQEAELQAARQHQQPGSEHSVAPEAHDTSAAMDTGE
ncbi:ATPase family associated with various cellular activities (AAA) domain-containing protein [Sarocladium implicatum]|nr:ATPase family associated with various cellular activities (AAA) domain-containing protein [Sarocladium implicatum]